MARAKANPDDLVHEPTTLYVLSERTIRSLLHDVDEDVKVVLTELNQDNHADVEILTQETLDRIALLTPPF